jgi:hypothetical protein
MMSGCRYRLASYEGMNSFVIFTRAIRPRMRLTKTFAHVKWISGAVNRVKGRERCRYARVMTGILDGVVIVSRGKVKGQVCMEEVLLELNARLFLFVSRDADIELERCSPHDDVR